MRVSQNEVAVWTCQTRGAKYGQLFRRPFRRVVAVEDPEARGAASLIVCSGIGELAVQREIIRFTNPTHAQRFIPYFRDVIAPNDINLKGSRYRPEANYNCHSFARAIAGDGVWSGHDEANVHVQQQVINQKNYVDQSGPLANGKIGYVLETEYGVPDYVEHSLLGLGRNVNECLSVLCIGGALAFMSYPETLDRYRDSEPILAAAQ